MVFAKVIVYMLQVRCGGGSPADTHFQDRNICSRRASISSSTVVLSKQTRGDVFHQTFRVSPCLSGDLCKLRFLLRCEMYFGKTK